MNNTRIREINSNLSGRMSFVQIGYALASEGNKSISFDLSQYNMIYAVGYGHTIEKYVGGIFMPKFLFEMHPQTIDYFSYWTGIIEYDSKTKIVKLKASNNDYSLYAYAVKI